jgi:hypothetical protein
LSTISGGGAHVDPRPDPAWRPPRVYFSVVDTAGRVAGLEVKVKRDVVEWWLGRRCLAAIDKEQLREWLQGRITTVLSGELALVHTRLGPVVEAAGVLSPSPLTPTTFLDLRDALA